MSALGAYRRLLGNRPLARLLAGEFVSSVGDWLYLVALLVVVARVSNDPLLLGVVGAARVLPYVVLSVPAGIVADRFERRLVLLVTDVARAAIMVVLAGLVAVDGPLAAIVALAVLATCFSTFFGPTIGSYLPSLVRDERELGPANSAWSTLDNLAYVIGPAIAGLLIAGSGLALAFLLNALSFSFVVAVLWSLPADRRSAPGEPGGGPDDVGSAAPGSDAGQGTAALAGRPAEATPPAGQRRRAALGPVIALGALDSLTSAVFGGLGVLTVILATDALHAGDDATGALNAALGVGGMAGAVVAGVVVVRARLAPSLLGGAIVLAAGLAALATAAQAGLGLGVALVALALAAVGSLVVEVIGTTLFQRIVPDRVRGRALGAIATVSTLAFAGGSLVLPVAATSIGYGTVLAGCAVVLAIAGFLCAAIVDRVDEQAPADAALAERLRSLPLFAGVPAGAIETAVRRMAPVNLAPGEVLIRQGEPADRCYVVIEGRLAVDRTGADGHPARVAEIGPDDIVGELGLLRAAPRNATVTATEPSRLMALGGADFLELVGEGAELRGRLLDLRRSGLAVDLAVERPSP